MKSARIFVLGALALMALGRLRAADGALDTRTVQLQLRFQF